MDVTVDLAMRIVAFFLGAVFITAVAGDSSNQYVQVTSFRKCPHFPDLPNIINETSVRTDYATEEYFITGALQLKEPIAKDVTTLQVTISRCLTEDDSNSCVTFLAFTEKDFCAHIADKNKVWSPVIAKLQDFDPVCPVPAGDYSMSDALITMAPLEELNAPNGFYEIMMLFLDLAEPQMCVVAKGKLRTLRRRKKKKPETNPTDVANSFRRSLKRKG